MAAKSSIEWTEATWNPVTGCTKISSGCKNCYAERMSLRLQAMRQRNYANGFEVTLHEQMLELPHKWKSPQLVFVNSMSDLFHENVPLEFIVRVFSTMNSVPRHRYQILTKRPKRLAELDRFLTWAPNIWMGITIESKEYLDRISALKRSRALIKFLSIEPLLGPIPKIDLTGIDWVIVGGESGPHARPMQKEWVYDIRDQCRANGIPFFFKQWGGPKKKITGRLLEGRFWEEVPVG
jgi:protein gp37